MCVKRIFSASAILSSGKMNHMDWSLEMCTCMLDHSDALALSNFTCDAVTVTELKPEFC